MTWAVPTIGGIQRMTRSLAGAISLVLLVVVSLAAPMDCACFPPLWSEPWHARASFAALATNYPPSTREEYVCCPIDAIETRVGWPPCLAAHGKQLGEPSSRRRSDPKSTV